MPGEVERLRSGIRLLSHAIGAFSEATPDLHRLLHTVAKSVAEVVGDSCVVFLREAEDELAVAAIYDVDPEVVADLSRLFTGRLGPEGQLARAVMTTGEARLTPSVDLEQIRPLVSAPMHAAFVKLGVRGALTVAMRVRGEAVGVLNVLRHRTERRPLDPFDCELVQDLATHAGLAISNARMVERLRESEAMHEARDEAVRATHFLDTMIEHIPDMVFVKDADRLAFTRFNRAGEELLGVSRADLIGKTDYDLFPTSEAEFFQAKDRETLAGKALVEIIEEPIQTARGPRWLHTKKVPILDEEGVPIYLLGISQDITDRKIADAELRHATEVAERASKELETFSYSVAHDLRAPLRGIDGFSQALLEDYADKLDEQGRRYLARVRESAQRMAMLIDDLLALSRVTSVELTARKVDLSALAQASVTGLQRLEPSREVEVVIEPGITVHGDPRMLAIALDNLLGNAWKFTSKVEKPRIELFTTDRNGLQTIVVRDNGAGFDMQYASKLFGVFQRLHTEAEFPGTGIGLVTVARIVHRHRGQVAAEGQPGRGATFYFTLGTEAE
ncbi:MAG: PAS domain-containing protein [Myxococcales bacterium]|nr:PAS domain-containing protein [Myxococcales bacterium]